MALATAMVDRAYRLRKEASPQRIEGSTVYTSVESPPIRCRLTLNQAAERSEDGRAVTEPTPTLITLIKDTSGGAVDWRASDRVRVESVALGTDTYFVDGEPEPMRKKRRVIGWSLRLRRVDEQENPSLWGG